MEKKNKYYGIIYKITNKINGKIYIGQTVQNLSHRWSNHVYDSKKKNFIISKAIRKYGRDGFDVETIETCNNKQELNDREIYWIEYYNTYKYGYNSTTGGEVNPTFFEETRKKISEKLTGVKRNFTIKQRSQYAERILKNGKQFKSGKEHVNRRGIYQLDIKSLNIIKSFDTIISAQIEMKGKSTGVIQNSLKRKSESYGYYWIYSDEYEKYKNDLSNYFIIYNWDYLKVPILQFDLNGNLLKEWKSTNEAEISINNKLTGNINKALIGKSKSAFGFIWIYEKDYNINIINSILYNIKKNYIIQLSLTGEYLNTFSSKNIAKKYGFYNPYLKECCDGIRKSYKDFKWMNYGDYIKVNPNYISDIVLN